MYCKNCGNQLNSNSTVCEKCGMQIQNKKSGGGFVKYYFIMIGIGIALFFVMTIISVVINIMTAGSDVHSLRQNVNPMYKLIKNGIIPIFQIFIPMLLIMFGWIPALIISSSKNK